MTQITSLRWWLVTVLTAALASSTAAQGGGSPQSPSCASKLTGCVDYINGTRTPPPECCGPLKEAVTNERECLCNIYNNTALLQYVHINITQALNLPKLCHIDTGKNANICEGKSPSSSSSGSAAPSPAGRRIVSGTWRITVTVLVSSLLILKTYLLFC